MKQIILGGALVALCAGCMVGGAKAPFTPPMGAIFEDQTAPLTTHYNSQQLAGLKTGKATSECILGIVATGDCSITAAAKAGGLTTIEYADYHVYNLLGIIRRTTVTAYGK